MMKQAYALHAGHNTFWQKRKQCLSTTQQLYPSNIQQLYGMSYPD